MHHADVNFLLNSTAVWEEKTTLCQIAVGQHLYIATHHRLFGNWPSVPLLALILAVFVAILYWSSASIHVFPKLMDALDKRKPDFPVKKDSKLLDYEETPLLLNTTDTRTENVVLKRSRLKTLAKRPAPWSSVLRRSSVVRRHPTLHLTKKKKKKSLGLTHCS